MARKNGLNRKEQIQCAKWITDGVSYEDLAKKFKTSVAVVKRFTQEKLDSADKKAKERAVGAQKARKKKSETAELVKEVVDRSMEDSGFE